MSEREMNEIADMEDECIIKLREMTAQNKDRDNKLLSEQIENQLKSRIERKITQMQRSKIQPALLLWIQKNNKLAGEVLRDLRKLDDKLSNPVKYDQKRKEQYFEFKQNKLQQLSMYTDSTFAST